MSYAIWNEQTQLYLGWFGAYHPNPHAARRFPSEAAALCHCGVGERIVRLEEPC